MKFPSTASEFRKEARLTLKGQYWNALLASVVAGVLGATISNTGVNFEFSSNASDSIIDVLDWPMSINLSVVILLIAIIIVVLLIAIAMAVGMFFLSSIVRTGYAKFNFELVNNQKPSVGVLFGYFKHWKRLTYTNFLVALRVFLWSLLFIIPGIIASYSYAMVPYILAENPNLSAKEVLQLSKRMMTGNRFRLFCLQFSFIGWILLSILTLGVGSIFLAPYQVAAEACFYKEISEQYWEVLNRTNPNAQEGIPYEEIITE